MLIPTTSTILLSPIGPSLTVQAHFVLQQPRENYLPTQELTEVLCHQCNHCHTAGTFSYCTGCKLVRYCSKENQAADWKNHKSRCKMLKDVYQGLVNWQESFMAWALGLGKFADPAFRARTATDCDMGQVGEIAPVGHPDQTILGKVSKYGGVPNQYLVCRRAFLFCTYKLHSIDAYQQGYDQAMDMLILDRADKYKARYAAPFHMLLLGKDQTAYDFLKWYITVAPTYDFSDTSLPFLDLHNANALESVDYITQSNWMDLDLSVLVAMMFLKLRISMDCQNIKDFAATERKIEREKLAVPEPSPKAAPDGSGRMTRLVFKSSIVARNPFIQNESALNITHCQWQELYGLINQRNPHFFHALVVEPHKEGSFEWMDVIDLWKKPFERGSVKEAYWVVRECIEAFSITGGAFDSLEGYPEWLRRKEMGGV
ncbi:hypothetical protein HK097_000598 [Rhizophlyctis rosea]|uniref:MYND-type domain-containing protein n=1 Tax=Rhizophlyctis rosea TaxID=64517 RepID=A0AAD5WZE4_9FUNG|nr:hypothetical protein HK097_000598 [Rhizophlyctis rosea]